MQDHTNQYFERCIILGIETFHVCKMCILSMFVTLHYFTKLKKKLIKFNKHNLNETMTNSICLLF